MLLFACNSNFLAEHIQKQLERGYASKDAQLTFWPTALGESLISAYRRMGLDNLWKPDLRGRIEQGISRIAAGLVTKDMVSTSDSPLLDGLLVWKVLLAVVVHSQLGQDISIDNSNSSAEGVSSVLPAVTLSWQQQHRRLACQHGGLTNAEAVLLLGHSADPAASHPGVQG